MISRNIFSIENQMQVIPLARNPREKNKKNKKRKKKKKTEKNTKRKEKNVTVLQFVPNHRYAIHVWKIVPRNHAVVCGSCRFHMFMVHVERSGTVLPFFVGVSTQSPLPSSCLGCGGLRCSHIFIICCVFYCFHSWFISCPGAFSFSFIFIYFHLLSFIFIYFHFFLFIFISSYFFSFLLISFHFFSFFFISFHFFSFPAFSLLKKLLPI